MSETNLVPYIPDTAPFTAEQRAYLNGFFAGLFSRNTPKPSTLNAQPPTSLQPLTILFGSQTGNAEALAKRVGKEAGRRGFAPMVYDLAQYPNGNLKTEKNLLLITSTYGDGDPPDNAKAFWEFLSNGQGPSLENLTFSVLALGDSNYAKFCACGKNFDQRLEQLGGKRAHPRVDCDVDYEEAFCAWMEGVLAAFNPAALTTRAQPSTLNPQPVTYSRSNPFPARLLANRVLNAPGSAKETRHFEISLEGSSLSYEAGDALGVLPTNCATLVDEILHALGWSADEPLRNRLLTEYDITKISQPLIAALAERSGDEELKKLASPKVNGELKEFLRGRQVIDLLLAYPNLKWTAEEFLKCLKKLQPRLYSISSSPRVHSGHVHLTISIVRYESCGRPRKGVCSTFLADGACESTACGSAGTPRPTSVPIFVHSNKNFRLPQESSRPLVMVGPGTGIAPFRAFLHDRRASGAKGKTWLFFGDQHQATDFLYRDEIEEFLRDGTLTRLDTAFSRDQAEKMYVQHRMLEHAAELFRWLEEGACFYVCGDATRMAKDVDAALHQIIHSRMRGSGTVDDASEYMKRLRDEKRYLRDVY
jgi:sulfite reductase (NADPH) flavoprotein alpha-component